MPLPKLATPTYELEVPSTGKKIKYRPFLVKEEKILLLAMETEDENQMAKSIIGNLFIIITSSPLTPKFQFYML